MDNAEAPSTTMVLEFKEDTALTEVRFSLWNDNFSPPATWHSLLAQNVVLFLMAPPKMWNRAFPFRESQISWITFLPDLTDKILLRTSVLKVVCLVLWMYLESVAATEELSSSWAFMNVVTGKCKSLLQLLYLLMSESNENESPIILLFD